MKRHLIYFDTIHLFKDQVGVQTVTTLTTKFQTEIKEIETNLRQICYRFKKISTKI